MSLTTVGQGDMRECLTFIIYRFIVEEEDPSWSLQSGALQSCRGGPLPLPLTVGDWISDHSTQDEWEI